MEHAFNCSERLWISQVDFVGQKEIDFLQRWKTYFIPSRQILEQVDNENTGENTEEVEEEPQPSTSRGPRRSKKTTTTTNSKDKDSKDEEKIERLKKRIDKLGDDFFAIPETIKKRKRKELAKKKATRKSSRGNNVDDDDTNSDEDKEDEEDDNNENEVLNNDNNQLQETQGEKEEELHFWNGTDGFVEDQYGHRLNLNEISSSSDDDDDENDNSSSSDEWDDFFELDRDRKPVDLEETTRQYIRGLGPLDKLHEILFREESKKDNNTQEETQSFTNTNENNSNQIIVSINDSTNLNSIDNINNDEVQTFYIDLPNTTNQNNDSIQNPVTELVLFDTSNTNTNANDSSEIEMEIEIDEVPNEIQTEDEDLSMNPENKEDETPNENNNNNNNTDNNVNVNNMQVAIPQEKNNNSEEEYFENLQRKRWEIKQEKERKDVKRRNQLQKLFGFDDKELDFMISQSQFTFDEIKRMPFVDEPVLKNGLMPILAPPIPRSVLKTSQALAVYVNFSSDPGEFQWKCKSANEQMADCVNDDLRFRKREEAKKKYYESTDHEEFVDEKDVIFTVVFYHTSSGSGSQAKAKEPEMAVTVNILGSQTLMDLRKVFYCKHDHIGKEIEGNPLESEEPIISKDSCLKAMQANMDEPCGMFVGSTMYRNQSSVENHDYAEELLKWSEGLGIFRKKLVGPFEAGEMETTKLIDLRFKHGFPYLFIHQGNCEHLMVIEKVRLVSPTEFLLKNDFPKIVKSNFRTVYCLVDNTRIARFAIRNSKWFPQDPMLICPECLQLCFKGNERVDNFKLFPFLQISSLF